MNDKQNEETAYTRDRGRGILTPTDRKYLLGEKKYSHPESARNRRAKIRQRIRNSIFDFVFLRYLETRDCDQIVNTAGSEINSGLSSAHLFLYDVLVRSKDDQMNIDMNLEAYIEQAVQAVDQQRGYRTEVSLEIEREELEKPVEVFQRAKKEGIRALTGPELSLLWNSDEVDAAEFASFLNHLFPNEEEIKPNDILKERKGLQRYIEELDRRR